MSKQTREEKRAQERRMIAEMDAAMKSKEAENAADQSAENTPEERAETENLGAKKQEKRYHCPKCKTLLKEDGLCPTCGYKMYIPMDEKKRNKIKLIVTIVAMVIFAVMFVILQFKK